MNDLAIFSVQRSNVVHFGKSGDNYATQLLLGRNAAFDAIQKYVPGFTYDQSYADKTLREIGVWESRNREALTSIMKNPTSDALPKQIQLSLGQEKAAAFLVAVFTTAASGIGPWLSGSVGSATTVGGTVNAEWARADADARLQVFGGIVKMENDGELSKFFQPSGTHGFGLPVPVLVAIVVAVVALASLMLVYLYSTKRLEQNNRLMRDLCEKAQKDGDQKTVLACVGATADFQGQGFVPTSWVALGAAAATIVGISYVAVRYMPWDKVFRSERA